MSFHVNGDDVMLALHVARIVGTIVTIMLFALVVAWAVRPSRRVRDRMERLEGLERDAAGDEDLWRAVDRMEARIDVLERALADQVERPRVRGPREEQTLAPAEEGRDSGRTL
jgi:cbb3-type cytochrome oxidase subunit 3